jgi:hypothetical protein
VNAKALTFSLMIASSLALAGCGGGGDENGGEAAPPPPPPPPPPAAGGPVEVELAQVGDSGQTGRATLKETPDGVRVVLKLASRGTGPHPAHIHAGNCPKPEEFPIWGLPDVRKGKSETVLGTGLRGEPAPTLADLRSKDYAINVHKSAAQPDVYIACGDIPAG